MELISVIVPVYNVEKYLRRCLDSIMNQTYGNLQIILIDDGSTDSSGVICDEYAGKDSRFEVHHKANAGVAEARNDALDYVKGKFVGFSDADDYLEADIFMQLYDAITEANADMAVCGYYEEYPDRTEPRGTEGDRVIYNKQEAYTDYFRMGGRIGSGCWNKLISAEALKGIRYKKYVMGEDVEMLCRTLDNCNRVVCIPSPGYHYIHREDSATQLTFRPDNLNIIHVVNEMAEYINNEHPELLPQLYAFHASWHVATLQVMKKAGFGREYDKDKKFLKDSIKASWSYYKNNPYMYKVDIILLNAFLINLFVPAQTIFEVYQRLKRRLR